MKRISNSATLWMHVAWPVVAMAILIYAINEVAHEAPNATQLIVLVVAMLLWRRFFGGDPYEVRDGDGALLVKRGREAIRVPYSAITRVNLRGGKLFVETNEPRLKQFTFMPENTSYLSTGASRREALEIAKADLSARIRG